MRLALGTVQFGKKYGISNQYGQTTKDEIGRILQTARNAGIEALDTASSYGESEEMLGLFLKDDAHFKIVTKTPYLKIDKVTEKHIQEITYAFEKSCKKLQKKSIYGLLVHNANNLLLEDFGLLYSTLLKLKKEKKVQKIGISIYDNKEIDAVLDKYAFDIIQVPINILDQRLIRDGYLKKLKAMGMEIHARSIFLQGLLLMPLENVPKYFDEIKPLLKALHTEIQKNGNTIIEAALGFVKNIPQIDYILTGINTEQQLIENIRAYNSGASIDFTKFSINNTNMLNPSKWKL